MKSSASLLLGIILATAVFYFPWKGLSLLVAREEDRPRKWLRYWWPTAMVAWSWVMLLSPSFQWSKWLEPCGELLVASFIALNVVGLIITNGLTLFGGWNRWVEGIPASVLVWLIWYGIIRFWQWRLSVKRDGSLHLNQPG